ncbi:MerR family transcriptional regulator [Loktanella sp. DJP18]|uniref:MerR family transcriptional regulator n=1 Tax=Loktanella sp. DJP18 TaxID=3409788 RepID=UPI003BB7DD61
MAKAPDAFRTISEVAEQLDTPAHVLRFWESKFVQVKPVKRAGGRRYYRPDDVALLGGIKSLLHDQGMTIKGAQKVLRDRGPKAVMDMVRLPDDDLDDTDVIDAQVQPVVETTDPVPANDTRADPPRRALTITMVENVHADAASRDAADAAPLADTAGDTVVRLTATVPPSEALIEKAAPPPPPDLPPHPAPRQITGSRLLGTLARMDRAAVSSRAGAIRPLIDRLAQAHGRLTQG